MDPEQDRPVPMISEQEIRSQLMAELKAEEVRIVALYTTDVNWSSSQPMIVTTPKRHWWSRVKRRTYDTVMCVEVRGSHLCKNSACDDWHPNAGLQFECRVRLDGVLVFGPIPSSKELLPLEEFYAPPNNPDRIRRDLSYLKQCQTLEGFGKTIHT